MEISNRPRSMGVPGQGGGYKVTLVLCLTGRALTTRRRPHRERYIGYSISRPAQCCASDKWASSVLPAHTSRLSRRESLVSLCRTSVSQVPRFSPAHCGQKNGQRSIPRGGEGKFKKSDAAIRNRWWLVSVLRYIGLPRAHTCQSAAGGAPSILAPFL